MSPSTPGHIWTRQEVVRSLEAKRQVDQIRKGLGDSSKPLLLATAATAVAIAAEAAAWAVGLGFIALVGVGVMLKDVGRMRSLKAECPECETVTTWLAAAGSNVRCLWLQGGPSLPPSQIHGQYLRGNTHGAAQGLGAVGAFFGMPFLGLVVPAGKAALNSAIWAKDAPARAAELARRQEAQREQRAAMLRDSRQRLEGMAVNLRAELACSRLTDKQRHTKAVELELTESALRAI